MAKVTGRGDETARVRTDEGRRLTVGALYPKDYGVGSTETVLEDGSWRRLAAEPYDPFGPQLLARAAALPGLSLLTVGFLACRHTVALRRVPVPVLRALNLTDHEGRIWVYAADDTTGRTPLLTCLCTAPLPDSDEPANHTGHNDAGAGEEELPFTDTRLHEVVVLGAPYDSGELVLVTTDRAGHPITIVPAGCGSPGPAGNPAWTPPPPRTPAPTARIRVSKPARNASPQSSRRPPGRPLL